jgi:hypothetical protein
MDRHFEVATFIITRAIFFFDKESRGAEHVYCSNKVLKLGACS